MKRLPTNWGISLDSENNEVKSPSVLTTTVVRDIETLLEQMDTTYKDLVRIDRYEGKQSFAMNKIAIQHTALKKIHSKLIHETITK